MVGRVPELGGMYLCEWLDHSCGNSWTPVEFASKENKAARILSVGWLVAVSKQAITLAASWDDPTRQYTDYQIVLRSDIVSLKRIHAKSIKLES